MGFDLNSEELFSEEVSELRRLTELGNQFGLGGDLEELIDDLEIVTDGVRVRGTCSPRFRFGCATFQEKIER